MKCFVSVGYLIVNMGGVKLQDKPQRPGQEEKVASPEDGGPRKPGQVLKVGPAY